MARIIPKKTKVRIQFYKNLTMKDALVILAAVVVVGLTLLSGLGIKYILAIFFAIVFIVLFIQVSPETRVYQSIGHFFRFVFANKKYVKDAEKKSKDISVMVPFDGIVTEQERDGNSYSEYSFIDYKEYFAVVMEIKPVQFYMLTEQRQNQFINAVDNAPTYITGVANY